MPDYTLNATATALLDRHADWWQRKGTLITYSKGAPLGDLWLPLVDGTDAAKDMDLLPDMLDVNRLVGEACAPGPLETFGDYVRTAAPYSRVPWMEAILGAPIRATIQGGSMRAEPFIESWGEWEQQSTCLNTEWLNLLLRMTTLLAARNGGRYAVAQTLMRGPSDLAEAVLGPELMSFSMYDDPNELRRFLDTVTETFVEVLHAQLERIPTIEGGYVSPFGIWAPGTVVRTQCDASAFLSPRHYAEWFLPYDVSISESVDYSIIHLHSCSLHTVDALLEVERPHAIQITLETSPGAPTLEELVPIFGKILAVKPLIAEGPLSEDDVQFLLDRVPQDGLCITARQAEW